MCAKDYGAVCVRVENCTFTAGTTHGCDAGHPGWVVELRHNVVSAVQLLTVMRNGFGEGIDPGAT